MTKNTKTIGVVVVLLIGFVIYSIIYSSKENNKIPKETTQVSIKGCYVTTLAKDVYTLTILSQEGELFNGTLSFKNFEKDSSSGTYKGIYKNGILLGDYSFQSEGMNSVMQVIFKKSGDEFLRGYGNLNTTGDRFVDLNNITYDSSYPFKISKENCSM